MRDKKEGTPCRMPSLYCDGSHYVTSQWILWKAYLTSLLRLKVCKKFAFEGINEITRNDVVTELRLVGQDDFLCGGTLFINFITRNAKFISKLHSNFLIRLLRDNPISQQLLLSLIGTLEAAMLTGDFLHGFAQQCLIALNLMLKLFNFILQLFDISAIK